MRRNGLLAKGDVLSAHLCKELTQHCAWGLIFRTNFWQCFVFILLSAVWLQNPPYLIPLLPWPRGCWMQYSWAVHLIVLPCPLPVFGVSTRRWTSVFRLPGDTAGPREHTPTHSELMMCLEQKKLFSHLGKNTIPSLPLPDWYFATSGLVSVVFS